METVIIVIHLMVIVALVAVILMQRSEGGALGIGGGGGNFLSSRGQGNVLTRTTAILAVAFFVTSISLTILGRFQDRPSSILDTVTAPAPTAPAAPTTPGTTPAPATGSGSVLDQLESLSTPATPDASGGTTAPAPPGGATTTPAPAAPGGATPATPGVPTGQ